MFGTVSWCYPKPFDIIKLLSPFTLSPYFLVNIKARLKAHVKFSKPLSPPSRRYAIEHMAKNAETHFVLSPTIKTKTFSFKNFHAAI